MDYRPSAKAILHGNKEFPELYGDVKFYKKTNGVLVIAHIFGLPRQGFFAFHIHEGKNCGGKDFSNSGEHFNPDKNMHPDHAGDLPPLLSCDGEAYFQLLTNRLKINQIIGRTVIIHSGTDDFKTQPSGNPGRKIACGVIKA